jgi:hypothetical protein
LVERIASPYGGNGGWRAETATIELNRQDRKIESVSSALGLSPYSHDAIKEDDLNGVVDHENLEWCRSVMAEYEALDAAALLNLDQLKKDAPLTFGQLERDAEEYPQSYQIWSEPFDVLAFALAWKLTNLCTKDQTSTPTRCDTPNRSSGSGTKRCIITQIGPASDG